MSTKTLDLGVGPHLAALDPPLQGFGQHGLQAPVAAHRDDRLAGLPEEGGADIDHEQANPAGLEAVVHRHDRAQPVDGRAAQMRGDLLELRIERIEPVLHHLAEQLGLAG